MDNDTTKEENQASTSKKEEKQKEKNDERDGDDRSFTDSASFSSIPSRLGTKADKEIRSEQPKRDLVKTKQPERKKKAIRRGRVAKRRRSTKRRSGPVRPVKRKLNPKREREGSVSTIFSAFSSRSGSSTRSRCAFCDHQCCGRR